MLHIDRDSGFIALHTARTTYQMQVDGQGRLIHLYYGPRCEAPWPFAPPQGDPGCWPNLLGMEWPAPGIGDNRYPFFEPEFADGTIAADLRFAGVDVLPEKYALPGLPAFRYGGEGVCVSLRDDTGLRVELLYGVFEECDLITRAAVIKNDGAAPVILRGAPSAVLDLPEGAGLDLVTFDGAWAAERTPHRAGVRPGVQSVGSVGGIPTHAHNPFVALCRPDAGEDHGDCWGAALVYSGNYRCQCELSAAGVRLSLGIEPYHFAWTLAPGEHFVTPEAAFVFSAEGFGAMSRRLHDAIRDHLLPAPWRDMRKPRPVLINSWEACYFDFDEPRLFALAAAAKKAGIDLFVLDDGWFKGRDADNSSLGDWVADPRKLPGGVAGLCAKINSLGLDFGIWIEPEAVNPDSDLYRAHPDWALHIPGRETLPIRNQYTLDFSREEVRREIFRQLCAVLDSCPVRYVKWDMNRSLANVYSAALPAARQGEVYHRYVLGVYEMQQKLTGRYPDLLLENCAGGGARFDCGMLYYSPQIWCSDNTDALDRLSIQYGTSFCYPPCVMGAHFSTVPNHITGRAASVEARMAAALSGTFGFELDLTRYTDAQLNDLRPYVDFYRAHGALLRAGDLWRLVPPTGRGAAWAIAAKDGGEAVVFAVGDVLDGRSLPLPFAAAGRWRAAAPGAKVEEWEGETLRRHGLPLPKAGGDLPGYLCWVCRAEPAG